MLQTSTVDEHTLVLLKAGQIDINIHELLYELNALNYNVVMKQDTKSFKLLYINNIKVDFVNYPYKWLEPAKEDEGVRMANLKDIAAMKLSAITNRGTRKDFVDIYFLLQHYSLSEMVSFYEQKYPDSSSFMVLRSLTYFEDAEEQPLPRIYSDLSWDTIKSTIQEAVRNIS